MNVSKNKAVAVELQKKWLKELGIDKEALARVIVKFPSIARLSPGRVRDEWQNELGIDKEVLAKAIVKFPPLAGLSPGE